MAPRLSGEEIPVQQGNSIHSGRNTRGTTLGGGKRQDLTPASRNRSAWTPVGQRHLIEAKRGKQLNVMAALLEPDHQAQCLWPAF